MGTQSTTTTAVGRRYSLPVVILWIGLSLFFSESVHILGNSIGLLDIIPSFFGVFLEPALSGVFLAWIVLRLVYKQDFRQSGCQWVEPTRKAAIIPQLLFFGLLLLGIQCVVWAVIYGMYGMPYGNQISASNPLDTLITQGFDSVNLATVLYMCVFAGLLKEPFARILIQNTLQHRYTRVLQLGKWSVQHSTLWTTLLLAIWYDSLNVYFFSALVISEMPIWACILCSLAVGLIGSFSLAYVYEKTQSMAAAVILHNIIAGSKILVWWAIAAAMV